MVRISCACAPPTATFERFRYALSPHISSILTPRNHVDLHGPWDAGVKQIRMKVAGHTNIPDIFNWTLPLWYDDIDPAKVNMGLAYYGRGHTLVDPNCNEVGCE